MSENAIKLVVGLGNPGANYGSTRHNLGFMALDALTVLLIGDTSQQGQKTPYKKVRCESLVHELEFESARLVLAKPQTFMNRSGNCVKGLLKHYNLSIEDVLVIHDDLDLPVQTLRIKMGGGHGGHNGLRSIIDSSGADFARIKIGIGRPPGQMPAERYVLQELRGTALEELKVDAARAAEAALAILTNGLLAAQNTFNG